MRNAPPARPRLAAAAGLSASLVVASAAALSYSATAASHSASVASRWARSTASAAERRDSAQAGQEYPPPTSVCTASKVKAQSGHDHSATSVIGSPQSRPDSGVLAAVAGRA